MTTPTIGPKIISVNMRHYPTQGEFCRAEGEHDHATHDGETWCSRPLPSLAVLVAGEAGDYAAYIGHGSVDWVAKHGDKLRYEEAVCHFPIGMEKEKYRL